VTYKGHRAQSVFHNPASPITLRFLQAFPIPQAAAALTRQAFGHAARARAHRDRQSDQVLSAAYARLQATYLAASATTVMAYCEEVVWLAQHLLAAIEHKQHEIARLQELSRSEQHPDHEVFASLPGTGDLLAPALLARFGDDRERFPHPSSLQCLAGTPFGPQARPAGARRPVLSRNRAATVGGSSSARRAITNSVKLLNRGPRRPFPNRVGRSLAARGTTSVSIHVPTVMPTAAWLIAGWRLLGSAGNLVSRTTKPFIYKTAPGDSPSAIS
jgi:hypothetical protein